MPYMDPDTMTEIANILDDFDEESLISILKTQIIDNDDMYTSLPINHFQPLYMSYKRVMNSDDVDEDDIEDIRNRFFRICIELINIICAKYQIELDDEWISDHYGRLPAITVANLATSSML